MRSILGADMNVMRVGLHGARQDGSNSAELALAALARPGPRVVLGGNDPLMGSVLPSPASFFGPRGVFAGSEHGPLWVADTGHHRLLGWAQIPVEDHISADWVLGQSSFVAEGRNAGGNPTSSTMNVPVGVVSWPDGGLAVADSWNNRVLVWCKAPRSSGVPADFVLGQRDFSGQDPNQGCTEARPDSMHWPFALLVVGERLYVADAGNRRILLWNTLPDCNAAPADFALGQPDLCSRSDNGGDEVRSDTMRWPHALAVVDRDLAVSDAGNNRVVLWKGLPDAECHEVRGILGQPDGNSTDHNRGNYWPDRRSLNMPYAMTSDGKRLFVGDTANSRILRFDPPLSDVNGASALSGQSAFDRKGDNRWGMPARDSLCWPYGMMLVERTLVIADTGNHRIALWDLVDG